jgi:hypothetical protein
MSVVKSDWPVFQVLGFIQIRYAYPLGKCWSCVKGPSCWRNFQDLSLRQSTSGFNRHNVFGAKTYTIVIHCD